MYSKYDKLFASIRSPSPLTDFLLNETKVLCYKFAIIIFKIKPVEKSRFRYPM